MNFFYELTMISQNDQSVCCYIRGCMKAFDQQMVKTFKFAITCMIELRILITGYQVVLFFFEIRVNMTDFLLLTFEFSLKIQQCKNTCVYIYVYGTYRYMLLHHMM